MSTPLPPMPPMPARGDLDGTLVFVQAGVERILAQPSDRGGIDTKTYMSLYTSIHNYVVAQKVTGTHGGAVLLGGDIYYKLQEILKTHLQGVAEKAKQKSGEDLDNFYDEQSEQYLLAARHISRLMRYLNRHWVMRQIDEHKNKTDVKQVYPLHLAMWKEVVFADDSESGREAMRKFEEKWQKGLKEDETLMDT